ncbi:LysE family transporter, partial [Pseudomonas syringae group genomosp. 7]|uniref:LysE family transporter n=1 Tax=Pseudomonas syringae group genomosp. 7 TaxID=251699 RepID=UPI00376FDD7D
ILSGTLSVSESLLNWISVSGCCFIAYLYVQALEQALRYMPSRSESSPLPTSSRHTGQITGFMVIKSNTKDIIFFVSYFPQFI